MFSGPNIIVSGLLFFTLPAYLQAQEPTQMDEEVELFFAPTETVTSPARHKQTLGMSPSAISVITKEDIEASGATTIADLLRMVPGMNVVIVSPFVTSITSRLGFTGENQHYLVLIDGREANEELVGMTFFETQPIALEDIERIEVIRGPASSLYGANSLAGVVSITTRSIPDQAHIRMSIQSGEAGLGSVGSHPAAAQQLGESSGFQSSIIAEQEVSDVIIEEPTLEEIFMHYYE